MGVAKNQAVFLELRVPCPRSRGRGPDRPAGSGTAGVGLCPGALGSHGWCVSRGPLGSRLTQFYGNSCGRLSRDGRATRHPGYRRAQGGPLSMGPAQSHRPQPLGRPGPPPSHLISLEFPPLLPVPSGTHKGPGFRLSRAVLRLMSRAESRVERPSHATDLLPSWAQPHASC